MKIAHSIPLTYNYLLPYKHCFALVIERFCLSSFVPFNFMKMNCVVLAQRASSESTTPMKTVGGGRCELPAGFIGGMPH